MYLLLSKYIAVTYFDFFSSSGEDALPNGLDVTFEVTELRRMTGSYNTMVGNNEGSMVSAKKSLCHLPLSESNAVLYIFLCVCLCSCLVQCILNIINIREMLISFLILLHFRY